jgi:hypothetical protein
MSHPAEMIDGLALAGDFEAPDRPMSMRRALVVWVGLSVGGWGLVAAVLGLTIL